ncbi:type I restriction enzyme R subunit [Streptomyces sp. V3I8]|uniref:EcoAI/FtnUII family type I restriction enzme subunit R n=1 Tax=Streptomyces sp. V3I8 TaxID=3042279 RepID=UPI002783176C|nr:DEAD/DEAH box helicase family protein [Streptomyces sp. V3I8]MDQ1038560.1 type I restriction enzyme R subunit [Streptomyces sp. V3I8]
MASASGLTEQQTCRAFVMPALSGAGWSKEQIREQYPINDGKIVVSPRRHRRERALIADYVLQYRDDVPIAVVEAKRTSVDVAAGIEQAKRYARRLGLPVAYATNGTEIWEIEIGGNRHQVQAFPSPERLWERYCGEKQIATHLERELVLAPFDHRLRNNDLTPKRPRYYQRRAVNEALLAIARGQKRILLTLATGTGKTMVAFQLVSKLRRSGWAGGEMPRVLYLADRNILVNQPKDDYFEQVFGDVVHKIGGQAQRARQIFFALYQALDSARGDETALFSQYPPDYFHLIIVDECHRGSSAEEGKWRGILDYFSDATQLGLTATPIAEKERDTYGYFGEPVYEYSLKDGIEDGFLAPYRLRRVHLNVDMTGFRPEPGQRDTDGNLIPDQLYTQRHYEKVLAIQERTDEVARYLTNYLTETDRMAKTIVFCENNDHAHRMVAALNQANLDLVARHPDYVCRVTDDDGKPGRELLDRFRRDDTDEPVIVATSQMLTTGVDIPSVRNIVILRRINSMPQFKQIIGRGTRLCLDINKGSFDIVDFVDATALFNDPEFDGPPLRVINDQTDSQGELVERAEEDPDADSSGEDATEPEMRFESQGEGSLPTGAGDTLIADEDRIDEIQSSGTRRIYVSGVEVFVWNDMHYQLHHDGQTMRMVRYREYVHDRVLELNLSPTDLRTQWAMARSRTVLRAQLRSDEVGITEEDLLRKLDHPEADPIDLLINAAWELPLISRAERAHRVRREHDQFLKKFAPEAREVLDALLDRFTEKGATELEAGALRVPPFRQLGTIRQLAARFGGTPQMHEAIDDLGKRIFDVA